MKLLLKVKNGAPPQRKAALRQLTEKARDYGAGPLFNQILPLLMSPTLEDQERHLLVKVIDRYNSAILSVILGFSLLHHVYTVVLASVVATHRYLPMHTVYAHFPSNLSI